MNQTETKKEETDSPISIKTRIMMEAREDLLIKHDRLVDESVNTVRLFHKYWRYLDDAKKNLIDAEFHYNRVTIERTDFYLGKASPEVYKTEPFALRILKSDVPRYLSGDEKVRIAAKKLYEAKSLVDYLEALMKNQINTRGFTIRDIIEWKKFTQGQS